MGWANCGTDSRGRAIGYGAQGQCDHRWGAEICRAKIDRGLAYACGGMHGEDERSCEGYFCPKHLFFAPDGGSSVCRRCAHRQRMAAARALEAS
jgi:hypothetical protein